METKITLKEALKIVVKALQNNTIKYDRHQISHCNCGLVAQAITGTDKETLDDIYLNDISGSLQEKMATDNTPTWSEMVMEYCPLTGEPLADIFKVLYEAGMKREDIAHLEYLSDPKILAASKIETTGWTETYSEKQTRESGWWIFKKTETVTVKKQRQINYYQVKENLIAYLSAWVDILGKENTVKPAMVIKVNGEEYKYRNSLQLENLKKHFLKMENYEGVTLAQEQLDKYYK